MLNSSILEASATMIIGILFIITLAKNIGWRPELIMAWFCVFGIIPFSISAILALFDFTEYARWACAISFVLFASWLFVGLVYTSTEKD
jgi:hypothetical protein